MWELYTFGEEPWAGHRAADVLRVTEAGESLRKPQKALPELFEVMQMCWAKEPEKRPKFSHLRNLLHEIRFITTDAKEDYVSPQSEYLEITKKDHVVIISEQ